MRFIGPIGDAEAISSLFLQLILQLDILDTSCEIGSRWMPQHLTDDYLDSKVHEANMGPTWVLSAPDGPHVGPINLAIRVANIGLGNGSVP